MTRDFLLMRGGLSPKSAPADQPLLSSRSSRSGNVCLRENGWAASFCNQQHTMDGDGGMGTDWTLFRPSCPNFSGTQRIPNIWAKEEAPLCIELASQRVSFWRRLHHVGSPTFSFSDWTQGQRKLFAWQPNNDGHFALGRCEMVSGREKSRKVSRVETNQVPWQ